MCSEAGCGAAAAGARRDILAEITERRRADIAERGCSFGRAVPAVRTRPVVPFLPEAGTILEIKRASPSKGLIAPELDAAETARAYISAGTAAISVLTEERYFRGSLDDLVSAADAAGNRAAILRKDFLLEPEEVEVAFRCGADAVLLIGRILPAEKLLELAEAAFSFGMSVLFEVREDSDVEKAFRLLECARENGAGQQVVLGINARDLATFAIDLLVPLRLKRKIQRLYEQRGRALAAPRIVSESGVSTPEAAEFVGRLGFYGVLIGEAAARNPGNAARLVEAFVSASQNAGRRLDSSSDFRPYAFWEKWARLLEEKPSRPLVKVCGLASVPDAEFAAASGADVLGFIFSSRSPRSVCALCGDGAALLRRVREALSALASSGKIARRPLCVGVVTDVHSLEYALAQELLAEGALDGMQFHDCSSSADGAAGFPAVPLGCGADIERLKALYAAGFPRALIDTRTECASGGTGIPADARLVSEAAKLAPLWLAGGVNPQNAAEFVRRYRPELIDVASGVEERPGVKDYKKITALFSALPAERCER
ncbi:MAG: bifunctional indole-3-glycerol phosphate synthase/phosphoribosylanthranilate isomerase [Treponemataceae bacterium]|nr:bifunctional indole-3-glycerol phosphate synthase/phosphoribosylanthranilate isomerase [Treponemataceae bacterium]